MCPHFNHLMFFKHICTPAPLQVLFQLLAATLPCLLCVLKSYLYFNDKLNHMVFSMVPVNQMMVVIIDFSSVKKSIIPVSLFSGTPHLVCSDLLSGTAPQVRLLLYIPCPRPAVSLFAKEPWSLILENSFRNQGLSARCAQFDRSSSIHPFLKHMPFPVPSLDKTPEQKRRMKCK